jgi:hypothetical protein
MGESLIEILNEIREEMNLNSSFLKEKRVEIKFMMI